MDLISRKAAIDAIKELLYEPDSVQYIWSSDALSAVKHAPSVPAVPLEMISTKLGSLCKPCIFHIGCPYKSFDCDSCNTSDAWEKAIIKWMEEEDGTDNPRLLQGSQAHD